jgi:hypothetical protein
MATPTPQLQLMGTLQLLPLVTPLLPLTATLQLQQHQAQQR